MSTVTEQIVFERWLATQRRREDDVGEVARAVATGEISLRGDNGPGVDTAVGRARREFDGKRAWVQEFPGDGELITDAGVDRTAEVFRKVFGATRAG